MKFGLQDLFVLLAAFVPLVALVLATEIDRWNRKHTEKSPQTEKLLRPPGHSLAIRWDKSVDAALFNLLMASAFAVSVAVIANGFVRFLVIHAGIFWLVLSGVLLLLFTAAGILMMGRAFRNWREAHDLRLGLRGEQAVAEALNEVADCGFRSFHDLPGGEDWNIDHVAVGTRGVFLIETKARRRRRIRNGQKEHEVSYDADGLYFPSGTDRNAIPQAKRNAKWLSNYLARKTGEPVFVEPVIVLPGWYVEADKNGNFPVKAMNAKYLVGFLRGQQERIEAPQVKRIIAALDEKCRDVEF